MPPRSVANLFGTHAMTFQSIIKINSRTPPNKTAHSIRTPHSDAALAVAFRYTWSEPRLSILLMNAVLSSQGKCACIPLVRSGPLSPPPRHRQSESAAGGMDGQRPVPCSCALIPSIWPEAQMCTRGNSNNLSNVSPLWDPGTCKCNPTI